MPKNVLAQTIARDFNRNYDEVRIALNVLAQVYDQKESERIVRAWAQDGLEALEEAARDEVDELARSQ